MSQAGPVVPPLPLGSLQLGAQISYPSPDVQESVSRATVFQVLTQDALANDADLWGLSGTRNSEDEAGPRADGSGSGSGDYRWESFKVQQSISAMQVMVISPRVFGNGFAVRATE
eukprot:1217998-Rhodomonas_salina.2